MAIFNSYVKLPEGTHTDQYGIQRFSCQDSRAGLSVGWGDGLVPSAMRSELRGA